MSEQQWGLAYYMQLRLGQYFPGLLEDILTYKDQWKQFSMSETDGSSSSFDQLPGQHSNDLPSFQKLLLIKLFKPHQLVHALKEYVVVNLGK